jgi:hypothetical protein
MLPDYYLLVVGESSLKRNNHLSEGNSAPRAPANVEVTGKVNQEDGKALEMSLDRKA